MRAFPPDEFLLAAILGIGLTSGIARAEVTRLVSVNSRGVQGNQGGYEGSISADGRVVAFSSFSDNLVTADTNGQLDVFVRELETGRTELISVNSAGEQGNDQSFWPDVSADGRYVAFFSNATNLDTSHPATRGQIFVRDRVLRTTEIVSFNPHGYTFGVSFHPSISRDGRFVAFTSFDELVP